MFEKLDTILDRLKELDTDISQPDIINNYDLYHQLLKERSSLLPLSEKYSVYKDLSKQLREASELLSDPELAGEAENEIIHLKSELQNLSQELRLLLIPPDPMDSRNVILEIRSGVGGDEAALFSADLLRMYQKYADRNGLHVEILSLNESDLGGINEALLMICGEDAFARMKYESGVHCVKRVPVTESSGRIHTSTVTVAVFPEAEDIELDINPSDLRIDVFHASGHGGQGVNTTDSAVRITHIPTNTVVTCQDERSQLENKAKAIKVLRSRLLDQLMSEQAEARAMDRRKQIRWGTRSDRIRTYYYNHDYVVDHRIGLTVNRVSNVMNGDLAPFIDALRLADKTESLTTLQEWK
jgi:peptide chain release factor 1